MLTGLSYRDATDFQLEAWRQGRPWHNPISPLARIKGGECCPDFSCCYPHLLAATATRDVFVRASPSIRDEMLGMFLGAACAAARPNRPVYIAGLQNGESQ